MSTPIVETPAPVAVPPAPPVRPWYKKKHFIGYTAAILLSLGTGSALAGGTTTVTVPGPAPAPITNTVTKTVAEAPAECGTALDIASQFVTAVSEEHAAMSKAFTQAGEDGDMIAMATSVGDAVTTAGDTATALAPRMAAAAAVCRAAIK